MTQPHLERLRAADGHEFDCWIAPAQGPARGGIVILQEIFGVTDQLKSVAADYAAQGFEVAIPALFDRLAPGSVIPFDAAAKGRDLMLATPADQAMMDTRAAIAHLSAQGLKVGVIGFCWGGGLALRAAQVTDAAAAVAFYGTRLGEYLADDLRAPVQMHFGTQDDHSPAGIRDRFTARFPAAEVHLYDAGHAFANDARPSFVPEAAATAHARTRNFLARALT